MPPPRFASVCRPSQVRADRDELSARSQCPEQDRADDSDGQTVPLTKGRPRRRRPPRETAGMSEPTLTGLGHVCLNVHDLESSVTWYGEVLGFQPLFSFGTEDFDR